MAEPNQKFYGWWLLVAACFVYGLGITPGYFGWGILFAGLEEELHYTKQDLGLIFGLFTFLYSGVGPIVGWLQRKMTIRGVMTLGSLMTALGYVIVSRSDSKGEFLIGFSILGGAGVGLSTIVPCQTLGQNWFLKRRASAIAILMASGSVAGLFIPKFCKYMLDHYSWRDGWIVIAGMSLAASLIAALFIRDTPEQLGQYRDGIPPESTGGSKALNAKSSVADLWTAKMAFRTHQFWLIVVAGTAYAVPWGAIISHGASHIRNTEAIAASVAFLMTIPSLAGLFGRLSGGLGDFLRPQMVLVGSLLLEGAGCLVFLYATSVPVAVFGLAIFGLGFGAAYVSIPVVFTDFFGRTAFGLTSGVRMLFTGIFNGLAPWVAGIIFDATQSYLIPFWGLFGVAMLGVVAASVARNPGAPPGYVPADSGTVAAKAA